MTVSDIVGDTFYVRVALRHGDSETEVDAWPSDAVALAVRSQSPIHAEDSVMERASFEIASVSGVLDH